MVVQVVVAAAAPLTAPAAILRRPIAEGLLAEEMLVARNQDQLIVPVVVAVLVVLEPPRQLALVGQVGRRQSREPL
jgi:hypothetical protein